MKLVRETYQGPLVIEPRHRSWVSGGALKLLAQFNVGKVMADPEPCPSPLDYQTTTRDLCYIRWHGSPVIYESRYDEDRLRELKKFANALSSHFASIWIIFDNTTFGWATVNALEMQKFCQETRLNQSEVRPSH